IVNLYNKHDAVERAAWGLEDKQPEAVIQRFDRMHFYAYPERGDHRAAPAPVRPSFRVAALVGQAKDSESEAVATLRSMGHLPAERGDAEVAERVEEAKRWLAAYAPDSKLRIELNRTVPEDLVITAAERAVFAELAVHLRTHLDGPEALSESEFKTRIFDALRSRDLPPRPFFQLAYQALLGREDGPAMSPFLLSMGEKVLPLLDQAAGGN
ncbi:MAG: hypothetical protein VX498_03110, partial [Myxococcota bacterium]|nr:hypothetical protein [Myxococcota bacterium]